MRFVDYVTITARSGKGGGGAISFRREKFQPKGGPDGGNGGSGGSVILEASRQLYTLLDLRYNRHHFAENGGSGSKKNRSGKDGEDLIIRVPVGTIAKSGERTLGEVNEDGARIVLAKGGRGGKGNAHFKTAVRQAPKFSQQGEDGEELQIVLELRLLADVGLVGFPNAGKSTLVGSISAAKPKVADYPFTTLVPSLGVVSVDDYQSFVIADIPGIIEGAHEGKGLGTRFLRHIERNAVLLFVIPVNTESVEEEYNTLLSELKRYKPELLRKPRCLALSKLDLIPESDRGEAVDSVRESLDSIPVVGISSVSQYGLAELKRLLWSVVQAQKELE